MSNKEIKKEKFKAVPEGATMEQHTFEGDYEKSDQYLVKDEKDGKYKIIEKSALIRGTLRKLDENKNHRELNGELEIERKIGDNEKLCNFVCENCDKLRMGQCKEEPVICDTCDGKAEVIYYRKKTEKGDMVFRKPFSAKKK